MKFQIGLLMVTGLLGCLSLIEAPYPRELWLQHIPTVLGLVAIGFAIWRKWFSTLSFTLIMMFIWLHILGARWIYSFVPYDDWLETMLGIRLNEWFAWKRNHYDRLVHWCFGLLWLVPCQEILARKAKLNSPLAGLLAWCVVMALSAVYEIGEWQLAVWMSPEYAESYNGQQGDNWDAQQDMALAGCGALVAILIQCLVVYGRSCFTREH